MDDNTIEKRIDLPDEGLYSINIAYQLIAFTQVDWDEQKLYVIVENYNTKEVVKKFEVTSTSLYPSNLKWSPDGKYLIISADGENLRWNRMSDDLVNLQIGYPFNFSPNSTHIAYPTGQSSYGMTNISIYNIN